MAALGEIFAGYSGGRLAVFNRIIGSRAVEFNSDLPAKLVARGQR